MIRFNLIVIVQVQIQWNEANNNNIHIYIYIFIYLLLNSIYIFCITLFKMFFHKITYTD